jgi:hypothetical protein
MKKCINERIYKQRNTVMKEQRSSQVGNSLFTETILQIITGSQKQTSIIVFSYISIKVLLYCCIKVLLYCCIEVLSYCCIILGNKFNTNANMQKYKSSSK